MATIVSQTTIEKKENPMGPQHDFRKSHERRARQALEFFRAELPDSKVLIEHLDAGCYNLVIEGCNRSSDRIDSLARSLRDIVQRPRGVDHYEHGAEVYFVA
jgi:hypothetical protein